MEIRDFVPLAAAVFAASLAYLFNSARVRADRLLEAYATWVGAVQQFLSACEDEWATWYEAHSPGTARSDTYRMLTEARKERQAAESHLDSAKARLMLLEPEQSFRDDVRKISFFAVPRGDAAMNDYMNKLVEQRDKAEALIERLRVRRTTSCDIG